MISIKQSVTDLDQAENLAGKSIECYRDAVRGVREHAFEACPPIAGDYRQQLEQLELGLDVRKILKDPAGVILLKQISEELLRSLSDFSRRSVEVFRQDTSNLRDILGALGGMVETLGSHNLVSADEFHHFGKELEDLTRIDDLSVLRGALSVCVVEFRRKMEDMCEKSRATISRLRQDVSVYRQKLDEAETQAATDPLTDTFNRRELQRQIDIRIEEGRQFSLLMFDLNEFKSINDRFGHAAGDQVLKYFAHVVKSSVRPDDVVARWGGDEFIVIIDAAIDLAISRSRRIFAKLSPPFAMQVNGRKVALAIRASSGVAEHGLNETSQQLFTRVDSLLYANKPAPGVPQTV